jgi:hypothetical protein
MQGGIERALVDLEEILGDLLQALRDSIAVTRAEGHDLENEHVESAAKEFELRVAHRIPRISTYGYTGKLGEGQQVVAKRRSQPQSGSPQTVSGWGWVGRLKLHPAGLGARNA